MAVSPLHFESLGHLHVNSMKGIWATSRDEIEQENGKQVWSTHWANSVLCRTSPTFPYLYRSAGRTKFPSWYTPLLPGRLVCRYHGNQMWLYPYIKAPALQDNSQTHCLASKGRDILLLKNVISKKTLVTHSIFWELQHGHLHLSLTPQSHWALLWMKCSF